VVSRLNSALSSSLQSTHPNAIVGNNMLNAQGELVGGPGVSFVPSHSQNGTSLLYETELVIYGGLPAPGDALLSTRLGVRVGTYDKVPATVDCPILPGLPPDYRVQPSSEARKQASNAISEVSQCQRSVDPDGSVVVVLATAEPNEGLGESLKILAPRVEVRVYRPTGVLVTVSTSTFIERTAIRPTDSLIVVLPCLLSVPDLLAIGRDPQLRP